jgi:hypothetical protein
MWFMRRARKKLFRWNWIYTVFNVMKSHEINIEANCLISYEKSTKHDASTKRYGIPRMTSKRNYALYCIVLYCIVLYRGGLICTLYDVAILEGKKPIGISLSVKSLWVLAHIIEPHHKENATLELLGLFPDLYGKDYQSNQWSLISFLSFWPMRYHDAHFV